MTRTQAHRGSTSHSFAMFNVWFLTVFLVLFPKGGLKVGELPLTWGYMYLGVTAPLFLAVRVIQMSMRFPPRLLAAVCMIVPFVVLYFYGGFTFGIMNPNIIVSMFISFTVLPVVFLFVYPPFLGYIDGIRFSSYFRWCILLAASWGLFLFFWKPFTGSFIEIPYITVNAADYGQLETTKHIARGFFSKLIATYNNGNLYGIATLILLPMYQVLEKVRWRKALVLFALLLTLARTVWAGLIIAESLPLVVLMLRQFDTFPVVHLGKAVKQVAAIAVTVALVFLALLFNANAGVSFLLDRSVGGRAAYFTYFATDDLVAQGPIGASVEVAYASVIRNAGWFGLAAFVLLMVSPLVLLLVDKSALRSPMRVAALQGLLVYALIAWVDGAIVLIPVMAFYWFAYMIYLFGWPNEAQVLASADSRRGRTKRKSSRFRFGNAVPASSL